MQYILGYWIFRLYKSLKAKKTADAKTARIKYS